jgi:hypothetical protein
MEGRKIPFLFFSPQLSNLLQYLNIMIPIVYLLPFFFFFVSLQIATNLLLQKVSRKKYDTCKKKVEISVRNINVSSAKRKGF